MAVSNLKGSEIYLPDLRDLKFIRSDLRGLTIFKLDLRGKKLSLRGAKYNLKKLRGTKIFINLVRGTKKSGRNPKLTPTWYPVLKMTSPLSTCHDIVPICQIWALFNSDYT